MIVDAGGSGVSARACRDETEAWTYASSVRQHVYWLSDEKFREYYRIGAGPEDDGGDDAGPSGAS